MKRILPKIKINLLCKAAAVLAVIALIAALAIPATLALLTATLATKENVFTGDPTFTTTAQSYGERSSEPTDSADSSDYTHIEDYISDDE